MSGVQCDSQSGGDRGATANGNKIFEEEVERSVRPRSEDYSDACSDQVWQFRRVYQVKVCEMQSAAAVNVDDVNESRLRLEQDATRLSPKTRFDGRYSKMKKSSIVR